MKSRPLAAAFLCAVSCVAQAQAIIGTVAGVQGLVTVSDATSVNTVTANMPVTDGSRFVASSSGNAAITVRSGGTDCTINLKPNQSVTVGQGQNCNQMLAAIQTLPGAPAVAAASDNTLPLLAGAAILLMLSSNKGGSTPAPAPGGGGDIPNPPISGQ